MEYLIFILSYIVIVCVLTYSFMLANKWNKKRFDIKAKGIKHACSILEIKEISIENKGCLFCVRVADEEQVKSISYSNPYNVTDIYINDELVYKIHRFENVFTTYRMPECTSKRKIYEIEEIVKKAYKISKKKLKKYYKTNGYKDSESFYNN